MNVDTSKVKVFRILGGEELVANLCGETEGFYELHRPLKVVHAPNMDGTATIIVLKYSGLSDDEWVKIPKNMVISILNPNKDALEYFQISYRRQYEDWAAEKSNKEQAEKDYQELQSILNEEEEPKSGDVDENKEVPEDEKDLDPEPEKKAKKHRSRSKKNWVN